MEERAEGVLEAGEAGDEELSLGVLGIGRSGISIPFALAVTPPLDSSPSVAKSHLFPANTTTRSRLASARASLRNSGRAANEAREEMS